MRPILAVVVVVVLGLAAADPVPAPVAAALPEPCCGGGVAGGLGFVGGVSS